MAETGVKVRSQAVGGNGEDVVDSADNEARIAALESITSALKLVSASLDDITSKMPENLKKERKVKESLQFMGVVKGALEEIKRLIESPLGRECFHFIWSHKKSISALIHVGTQVIGASIIVYLLQDLMDVKDSDFKPQIQTIESCIQEVDNMLPDIKSKITNAVENLKKFQEDCVDKKILEAGLREFDSDIRFARNDIDECRNLLCTAGEKIQECIDKISEKKWRYFTTRILGLGSAGLILFGSVKSAGISTKQAVILGTISGALICYGKVPRYRQLLENLRQHQEAQENLMRGLQSLKNKLDAAITSRHAISIEMPSLKA